MPPTGMETTGRSRREFLRGAGWVAATCSWLPSLTFANSPGDAKKGIAHAGLDLNRIKKWDSSNGDTWDPFWAEDGNLYSFNCDGRGFGRTPQNMAFNGFSGEALATLTGRRINAMFEYGHSDQRGPDGATWKACGQECIDGVLYAFVASNTYGSESPDPLMRQTAFNSSLIKSEDNGMHGWGYTEEQYIAGLPNLSAALRSGAPGAKLIWASATPMLHDSADAGSNQQIDQRNRLAAEEMSRAHIPVDP